MKKIFLYIAVGLLGTVAPSCSDDGKENIPAGKPGEQILLGVRFEVDGLTETGETSVLGSATRSITPAHAVDEMIGTGDLPNNMWVVQFDQTGKLVGAPTYYDFLTDGVPASIPVLHSGGEQHTLFFLGNTHNPDMEWGSIGTLDQLRAQVRRVEQETDCYVSTDIGNFLLMNDYHTGVLDGGDPANDFTIRMRRNTAKLTFRINNDALSGLAVESVQLCNVPTYIHYADRLCTAFDGVFPVKGTTPYMNYPTETLAVTPGTNEEITWYMPRNEMGTFTGTMPANKNEYAPLNATYIRVFAKDTEGKTTRFTLYPGMNMTNDFNVKANHHHTVGIHITGKGDPLQDSRIDDLNTINFASANSYILNPGSGNEEQRVFTFPVTQANKFWHTYDPTREIGPRDKWIAVLLWQDVADGELVRFVDTDGYLQTSLVGEGSNARIRVTVKNSASANAVIGILPANDSGNPIGDEYLWSWHLWITDYDPDAISVAPVSGQYIYPVDENGGAVHRYAGAAWENGIYKDKFIMDRNLGTLNPGYQNYASPTGVLHYQYGRKDPFPVGKYINTLPDNVLYDISGNTIDNTDTYRIIGSFCHSLPDMVSRPLAAYCGIGNGWYNGDHYGLWYDSKGKTIFDPCPPGWTLPESSYSDPLADAWCDFRYNATDPTNSTVLNESRPEIGTWNNGTNYWPVNTANNTGMSIFFPAHGGRGYGFGFEKFRYEAMLWSKTPRTYSATTTYNAGTYLSLIQNPSQTPVLRKTSLYTFYGYGVRCIQE